MVFFYSFGSTEIPFLGIIWSRRLPSIAIKLLFFGLREIYELGETKKDSIISNKMIHKSSLQIQSMEWTNYSLTEKKIKDLTKRTNTIKNQIEKIRIIKGKKNEFLTQEINISSNKISYQDKILESSKKFITIVFFTMISVSQIIRYT